MLEEVHAVAGDGSLIPTGTTYREYMNRYKHHTRAAGLGNAHGLRHAYAQWRYAKLTGWKAPAAGGPTSERMTPDQARRDRAARLKVSRELGHNRIDIADTYLGRAKAAKAGGMSKMIDRARKLTEGKREAVAAELLAWSKVEDCHSPGGGGRRQQGDADARGADQAQAHSRGRRGDRADDARGSSATSGRITGRRKADRPATNSKSSGERVRMVRGGRGRGDGARE